MNAPLLNIPTVQDDAKELGAKLQRVTLADVLSEVEVTHHLASAGRERFRLYKLRLSFIDPEEYNEVKLLSF